MLSTDQLEQRVRDFGHEIFERAAGAMPWFGQKAWWLERMTDFVDQDEQLKSRAFQFVDCLPALQTDASVVRHLREYLGAPSLPLPGLFPVMLNVCDRASWLAGMLAKAARIGATQMAGRFICGYDARSAIKTIEKMRRDGMTFTLDVLGESTTSEKQADRYLQQYLDVLDDIAPTAAKWSPVPLLDRETRGEMPRVNVSVKLTSLDPHFDAIDPEPSMRRVADRLRPLLRKARAHGAFVNVDIESTKHRRITFELFRRLLMEDEFRDWTDVGIVVQAYLQDGERDLEEMLEWGRRRGYRFAVRLVKGAYWDAESAQAVRNHREPPVWKQKWQSDACYERMTCTMLANTDLIRPAFASHNVRSLAHVIASAELMGLTPRDYEVQMLFGMGDPLKWAMVQMEQCLRVYCPYGELMPGMAYLIRRLLENTSNDSFLKQGFRARGTHARLLMDPTVARPPSAPLPKRHYVNTDPEEPMSPFVNAAITSFAAPENRAKMLAALEAVRANGDREYPLIINDAPIKTTDTAPSINPARTSEVLGRVARASTADADQAVAAARKAFPRWGRTSAADRAHLLHRLADRIEECRFELAATMVLECGKPWREADGDITEGIDHCRFYAEQIVQFESRPRLRNVPGENNALVYVPRGVAVVIGPWCFPVAMSLAMTSAALAAGNTVVLKPATPAAVVSAKLFELMQDVGMPPGVVSFLPGDGATVGTHLIEHEEVDIVAFTGSSNVGIEVLRAGNKVRSRQAFIRKLIVEMGGKNAIIVDDDADLDGAVQGVMESAFGYAGQKCSACSRVVLLEGVAGPFLDRLTEAVESLKIGPADEPSTFIGPIIDQDHLERIRQYVELGRQEATLHFEGTLPADCEGGCFAAPVIFDQVPSDSTLAQDEIFGPVLSIQRATDFSHAIELANDSRYALTGGVYSRSPANIERARRELAVGNLYINRKITGSQVDVQPFGGFKLSGTGVKAGSPDYILHYMAAKCITENTLRSGLVPQEEDLHAAAH
jgi:RHH-type proline utilization regulon transcriptional repressor/proline dehydrogenase/delta 1-pyrroline-5-carboxylate dehydrogenase